MINLEKTKKEKCQPPLFKKSCPCYILPPPFFNNSDSLPTPGGGNHNLLPALKKRVERGGPKYEIYIYIYI